MAADPWKLVGTTVGSRYRVDAFVAVGGSGRVYRATDQEGGAPVALKVLKPPVNPSGDGVLTLTEEFVRERDVLARVEHPGIVGVYGHGEIELPLNRRTVYLALEWVEGPGLDAWLKERGALAPGEAIPLLAPIFEALVAAHGAGVAHRDIKPANIVVQDTPDGPRLRLLDFGIAKLMQPHETLGSQTALTMSRNPAFSTAYAAPEQLSGAQTGPWTDVHAMGLLLTEALIGRRAYEGVSFAELLGEILATERPTPAHRGVDVGPLEPVIARSLAARPQSRFSDMGGFWGALQAAAGARVASPAPIALLAKKKKKKKKGFAVELLVGAGIGTVLAIAMALLLFR